MNKPFFTVVTPALNCSSYLLRNIESVRSQGLLPQLVEHWIVDGGSTDGTVELLNRRTGIQFVSERDRGLSHAVNKGVQRAAGEWIIWLNADDQLAPNALKVFIDYTRKHPGARIFSGGQKILRYDGSVEQEVAGWDYNLKDLLGARTSINQASTFVHHTVYQKVGLLDESIRYAMDYEWTVRAMHHYACVPIPEVLTFYQRREGSLMDSHMVDHFRTFLRVRRDYKQSRFSTAEFSMLCYIYTDPLRRVAWLRRAVRGFKRLFGQEPLHPMS